MKIDLDIAIISAAFLCILSFLCGALSVSTPEDKLRQQIRLEQQAIASGKAIQV